MNQSNAVHFLPLVQAITDGKTIQIKNHYGWVDLKEPAFTCPPSVYRIKPEVKTGWINVYKARNDSLSTSSWVFATKDEAYKNATVNQRIACIQITFEEGDGL